MNKIDILNQTKAYVYQLFDDDYSGHDFFHVERVVKMGKLLAEQEQADSFTVELAAWLHDVGDYKLNDGVDKSEELISAFLSQLEVPQKTIDQIIEIVSQVSFSKGNKAESLEAKIVQDADRLDAIGAIGLARVFAYGGHKGREIYNPLQPETTSIQHFYDKLLKLKNLINTSSARQIAEERHLFLENFLAQFYKEWNVEEVEVSQ